MDEITAKSTLKSLVVTASVTDLQHVLSLLGDAESDDDVDEDDELARVASEL